MKLIIAIVADDAAEQAIPRLLDAGLRVTRVASTGGFLRRGNTTLLLGLDDKDVDRALDLAAGLSGCHAGDRARTAFFSMSIGSNN
jgi:uncharacterized protein YaaQ